MRIASLVRRAEMGTVGLVGAGTMGAPVGRCLLAAGHAVRVADRNPEAVDRLARSGATPADTPARAAAGSDGVFLSLPGPEEVIQAVSGPDGVLAAQDLPPWIADLSTNSPDVVSALRSRCGEEGVAFIDAPVSGGRPRAEAGTLSVMVGGSDSDFRAVEPYLQAFGAELFHVGRSGAGTIAKLANNQLFLAAGVLLQEAYLLASAAGLDPSDLHPILRASSAATYSALAPMLLNRDVDEVNFRLDIAAKDLALAAATAASLGVRVPATQAALDVYESAVDAGLAHKDFHATLRLLEDLGSHEMPPLRRRADGS
jgi:3-hydroxyisobutyrate dehydrogenase-like beta-hydroxyacid dehydrogenase